ncbi:MAG: hypothetical protein AMK75_02975 [Planctomycetes bacterium SM23_65]|nr:MAG: hypothetical protein AMK75_02975 [Planctomycetes bacterium SM23_65]
MKASTTFLLMSLILAVSAVAAPAQTERVVFLDNRQDVVNGSSTYDPATRTCGQGKYTVFTELDEAARALDTADTLYVRAGTYSRAPEVRPVNVHGSRVNYWTGALAVSASGTPEKRKVVSAYQDETVVIQAKPGASHYNPEPGDNTFKKSSHYYPSPAISIGGAYVDLLGFKTYGQVVISGHDVTLQQCDLGGGGPHMNQGQVVAINSNRRGGVYNVVIRSNRIHHSCWGEGRANASALMCYNASFIVENNEFHDNYGADIRVKDTGGQQGRDVVIRYNFFGPSRLHPESNTGTGGLNQDKQIDRILIHHNVFFEKSVGCCTDGDPPRKGMFIYNNTFINCGRDLWGWTNAAIHAHNNLFYHSKPRQRFYDVQAKPVSRLQADCNLFFSTAGDTHWWNLYRVRAKDLDAWRRYSDNDRNSVWKPPELVNPSGKRPEDFKRKGKPDDVAGSTHGSVCGAYVTGKEIIGLLPKKRGKQ